MILLNLRGGRFPLQRFYPSEEPCSSSPPAKIAEWESSTPTFAWADLQGDTLVSLILMARTPLRNTWTIRNNLRIFRTVWHRPGLPLPKSWSPRTVPVAFSFPLAISETHGAIPILTTAPGRMRPPGSDTSVVEDTRIFSVARGMSKI